MESPPGTEPGAGEERPREAAPAGESARTAHVLACDHRGTGWERRAPLLREHGLVLETTLHLRETLDRLERDPRPDLLLVDPLAGAGTVELTALEARRIDLLSATAPIPVLLVVESEGEDVLVRASQTLVSGHWDLVRRDAGAREVALRSRRLLDSARAADEMEDLRHRAFHDDRTDLLRPLAFQSRLREHFSAAQRHHQDLALVLIDLDRFGQINKQHDHTIGDAIIALVGEVIRGSLRTEDVAGRLGGDEFAVLLPYTRKLDASQVVSRLQQEIKKLSGRPGGARSTIAVSASLGFETYDGSDLDSLETLRRHAERALRVSKVQGGDRATYFRSLPEAGERQGR